MPSYSSICLYYKWAEKHKKLYVTCLLIACFFLNFFNGSLYSWGNIQPYIVSYIRQKSSPSTLRYTESTYIYSTQYAGFAIGIALGGFTETILGVRMSILIGSITSSVSLLVSYFLIQHSFWLLFITFGVLFSVGTGMVHFPSVICVSQWVKQRTGLAIGFIITGTATGTLSFSVLQTAFINPHDEFPNDAPYETNPDEKYFTQPDLIERVPLIFLVEGGIFMLLIFIATPFLSNAVETDNKKQKGTQLANQLGQKCYLPLAKLTKALIDIFHIRSFYLQWFVAYFNVIGFGVVSSLYKTYGIEELQLSDYFLTAIGAVASGLFSIFGRLLFGFLADKLDYKISYVLQSGLMAIFLLTLYITSLGYRYMYFIWVGCVFMCYGGYCTLVAVVALRSLGKENFNFNFSMICGTSQVVASFTYGIVSDFCLDYLSWSGTFLLLGCLTIIQTCLIMLIPENEHGNGTKKYTKYFFMYVLGQ